MTATRIQLTISIADDHLDRFDGVVAALRGAGLDVESALDSLGIITGSAAPDRVDALRRVPGVAHVEPAREYRVPPPDSDVQ